MYTKTLRPFYYLGLLVLIVGMACSLPSLGAPSVPAAPTAMPETNTLSETSPAAQTASGAEVIQQSTDKHWIFAIFPVKNTNSTCDQVATLGEWHGCDEEVLQKLLDLYKNQPGAGIVYFHSYAEASEFLIANGWSAEDEVRIIHAEELRLDELHDGEGRVKIADMAKIPLAADHDGSFGFTWDVNPSLFQWNPSMTPIP